MRKVLIAIAVSLSLAGCAQLQQALQTIESVRISATSPVSRDALYAIENSAIVVFAGLKAYRQSCVQGALPPSCKDVIRQIQPYTRRLPPLLRDLRVFVKNNDQPDAMALYNQISQIITDVKSIAFANSVQIGG